MSREKGQEVHSAARDLDHGSFRHRSSYGELPRGGRDFFIVRLLEQWLATHLQACLETIPAGAPVLDAGCGEQPLRTRVESLGRTYVGLDVVQNAAGSVDVIASLDGELPAPWPRPETTYPVVICTEVLEHLTDPRRALANLRALTAPGGRLVLTTPFAFPLHMEPYDYFRYTPFVLEALAQANGFAVERADRLGHPLDLVATFLADVSILPARRSLPSRAGARIARLARNGLLRLLDSRWLRRNLRINGNSHLSNAYVFRAV